MGYWNKRKNNGVLILVSKAEHKARIETGSGMEGVLPDILAKQIIDERMVPYFKENDYYRGFDNAVDAIIQAAAGEYKADPSHKKSGGPSVKTIIFLVIIFFVIISFLRGGGGGGSYMSRRGSRGLGVIALVYCREFIGRWWPGWWWFWRRWVLVAGGGGFGGFGGGGGGGGGASGGW